MIIKNGDYKIQKQKDINLESLNKEKRNLDYKTTHK